MSYKFKCKDCIWLDIKNKSKAGLCECLNTSIKHTKMGYLKSPSNPACVKGFEGFEGQTIGHAPKRTYEQGYADAIEEFRKFLSGIDKGLLEIFNQLIQKEQKNDT